ncbi:hypothetical protein AB0D58_29230 [Streptomyces sp. NPDC048210]|uniref:hypothetical protein n=1 Tax=unclassified Streptomyces TaxID=2593676 RepID=UPI002E7795EA|nr:hypothetical protein [Streptomyces sp. JV181]MEE1775607.1 hypothetical protein [Streptomyces sp. JV181]
MSTETREFIIVGKDTGASFILWDVMPAPTDPTKRDMALEEIGVDVHDAFGSCHMEWATTATGAVNQLLTNLRKQSGIDDYALSETSNRDALTEDREPR